MRRTALPALLLVAGCGGAAVPAVPSTAPLSATLARSPAAGDRRLQVELRNASAAPVRVLRLQLRGGGFVQVPPSEQDAVVAAGGTLTVPLAYGQPLCEGRPAPVAVVVATGDGPLDVPVPGDALLADLRAQECARG